MRLTQGGGAWHRGSIRSSHPACPGLNLTVGNNQTPEFYFFVTHNRLRPVTYRGASLENDAKYFQMAKKLTLQKGSRAELLPEPAPGSMSLWTVRAAWSAGSWRPGSGRRSGGDRRCCHQIEPDAVASGCKRNSRLIFSNKTLSTVWVFS